MLILFRGSRLPIRSWSKPRWNLLPGFPALEKSRLPGGSGFGLLDGSGNARSWSPETRSCNGGDGRGLAVARKKSLRVYTNTSRKSVHVFYVMKTLIAAPAEIEIMPRVPETLQEIVAVPDPGSIFEAIQTREKTVTLVMENILQFRPSSHWGINE